MQWLTCYSAFASCAAVRSFYLARCQPHGPDGSLTAHQQDEIGWRAIFAVQLHSVIEAPEFPAVRNSKTTRTHRHRCRRHLITLSMCVLRCLSASIHAAEHLSDDAAHVASRVASPAHLLLHQRCVCACSEAVSSQQGADTVCCGDVCAVYSPQIRG